MSQLNIATLANLAGSESTPIADVINGSARAFVNFNGTGTVAIRASYNVSSITDNGTGDYTVNFTNAMQDSSYAFSLMQSARTSGNGTGNRRVKDHSTSSIQVETQTAEGSLSNAADVTVAIFR